MLGIGALFLLFVLLYSQRVASQSCETLGELLHHPAKRETAMVSYNILDARHYGDGVILLVGLRSYDASLSVSAREALL